MAAMNCETESVDLAIVGMAASFADAARLPDYWHGVINGTPAEQSAGPPRFAAPDRTEDAALLQPALRSLTLNLAQTACEDAGYTVQRLVRERARLILTVKVPAASASPSEDDSESLTSYIVAQFGLNSARLFVETPDSASSLIDIKSAMEELRAGHCDVLLVVGVGEGGGALVLKRLADARRFGESIYALVKDVSVSAREGADEPAPRMAFNCNDALRGSCPAGVLGLIKVALALYDKVLPASCAALHPTLPAGETPLSVSKSARPWIHAEDKSPRRASLYEFCQAAPIAHLLLEEYVERAGPERKLLDGNQPTELLCFSGESQSELLALVADVQAAVSAHKKMPLSHLAYTLALRGRGSHRLALLTSGGPDLLSKLDTVKDRLTRQERAHWQLRNGVHYARLDGDEVPARVAFMFPGYGSYYPWMLADLCRYFPQVRSWFDTLDGIFNELDGPLPSQLLFPAGEREAGGDGLHGMRGSGEGGLTATLALHELLQNLGIRCDVMLGHSNGENAALIASGTMRFGTRREMFDLIRRVRAHEDQSARGNDLPKGVFLGVSGCAPDFITQLLAASTGRLHLALDNCPHQVVLFGDEAEVEDATKRIKGAGGIALRLPLDVAYHTPFYEAQAERLRPVYDSMDFGSGHTRLYSCATAQPFPTEPDEIRAVALKQWSSRVRFRETLLELYDEGVRTFIEVGPNSTLTGFAADTLRDQEHLSIASNTQRLSDLEQLQRLLAQLYVGGMDLNLEYLFRFRNVEQVTLPSTATARATNQPSPAPRATDVAVGGQTVHAVTMAPAGNGKYFESQARPHDSPAGVQSATGANRVQAQSPPARPAVWSPAIQTDARAAILNDHFELMQLFLANQARVLATLFPGAAGAHTGAQFSTSTTVATASDHVAPDEWPLLGQIIELDERRLHCRRRFDLQHDTFLLDHTLGRRTAGQQARLPPLPVVPFTVSMEILAEAASCLLGGEMVVVSLHDVRGHRWLALEQDALVLDVVAEVQSPQVVGAQDVRVQVFEPGPDGQRQLSFEGLVRLARHYPSSPLPLQPPLVETMPVEVSAEDFYRHLAFHGPCFQGIKRLRAWNEQAIEVEMEVPPTDAFFAATATPSFQVPAGLLDSTGQLVGLWLLEQGQRELAVFPFHAASFEQYRAPHASGSRLLCRAAVRLHENAISEADFDFIDETNQVVARLTGLQLKNSSGRHIPKILIAQSSSYFSDPWLQAETCLACRRIDAGMVALLEDGRGIWKRALARQSLNEREREFWSRLPEKGVRRAEWLAGRVAAKDAARQWAEEKLGLMLAPEEIEIDTDESGRPFARCTAWETSGAGPYISISHSHGNIVAIAADTPVGIDVETLSAGRDESWLLGVFGEQELALVARQDMPTLLALWCAKESAAKSAGMGLRADPRAWQVVGCSSGGDRMRVAHESGSFAVELWQRDEVVFALARPLGQPALTGNESGISREDSPLAPAV